MCCNPFFVRVASVKVSLIFIQTEQSSMLALNSDILYNLSKAFVGYSLFSYFLFVSLIV